MFIKPVLVAALLAPADALLAGVRPVAPSTRAVALLTASGGNEVGPTCYVQSPRSRAVSVMATAMSVTITASLMAGATGLLTLQSLGDPESPLNFLVVYLATLSRAGLNPLGVDANTLVIGSNLATEALLLASLYNLYMYHSQPVVAEPVDTREQAEEKVQFESDMAWAFAAAAIESVRGVVELGGGEELGGYAIHGSRWEVQEGESCVEEYSLETGELRWVCV